MERKDEKILTLGIFAHANAGKTTITEQLLYHTNVIDSVGRVDTGNTVTDDMKVEQDRGITVRDSIVSFKLNDKIIQLIDTPGHVDFSAEVERAINVLDGAVLVISGVEGLEAQTYTIYRALREKNVPIILFINKMDRKGADFDKVLGELKNNLKIQTLKLTHVYQNNDNSLKIKKSSKEEIIEDLSIVDEEILERYLNNQEINDNWLNEKMIDMAKKCKIFPVIGGSALNDIGINDLVDSISLFLPTTTKNNEGKTSAYVFMVRVNDEGKNAYIKVLNGTINNRDSIFTSKENLEKVKNIKISDGSKLKNVNAAYCGDIAIITGLDVKCGQLIGNQEEFDKYISFVKPLLTMEVKAYDKNQTLSLMKALKILNEEDPYLDVRYSERTNSIFLSLMGDVQTEIIKTILKERFNIETIIDNPIIIHKEIPTQKAKAKASYTCVSGIELEITPLERGSGFRYVSKLSTDFLHIKYQRQIERLINYYSKQGLNGWELTDMEVALIGGQFDSMGSDPEHFNIITPIALFRCLKKSNMKLIEPILSYIIKFPEENLSNVIKLISSKGGIYKITNSFAGEVTIEGELSASNMMNFPLELSASTSGRGTYSSFISKYEISNYQDATLNYIGLDPRNETTFIINDMKASLDSLDEDLMKKKKESRSKFARMQKEKAYKNNNNINI